jgi:hypothetical protein
MTKDEALKMAIKALLTGHHHIDLCNEAIKACKEALADNSFCKHGLPRGVCTLGEKDCE